MTLIGLLSGVVIWLCLVLVLLYRRVSAPKFFYSPLDGTPCFAGVRALILLLFATVIVCGLVEELVRFALR